MAPVTNFVSQHLIGNIPHFVSLFLDDQYNNPDGKYFQRSPVMHAHKVKTLADSTACRARIPRDAGPVFHGKPGHRSIASRAG